MSLIVARVIGWCGALMILAAYILVSFEVLSVKSAPYQVLNIIGALGIIVISFYKRAYSPGVLNIVWVVIATIALVRIIGA